MHKASRQFQNGLLALNPAKALPLLFEADDTAYSTSLNPCGPGFSMALRPASVIMAIAVPIRTSAGVTRIANAVIFISRTSIFLPRYSGVRPIINPAINTASSTNSSMPYRPEPTPPKTTSPICINHIGTMPPSAVKESCIASTAPQDAAVVTTENRLVASTPKRLSLPSMLILLSAPNAIRCGLP